MPWSGGSFTRLMNWVNDKNAAIPITASRMDLDSNDFTSGINNCLAKDGSNTPTSALNMGALRVTNLADGTARTDAATVEQAQDGKLNFGTFGGSADALTMTLSPSLGAPTDGLEIWGRLGSANATTTPTFAFNATTARTIVKGFGLPLAVGDLRGALAIVGLRYDNANTRWVLLNPPITSGVLAKSGASVSCPADTTEDTLATITLPANALGANGVIDFVLNFQTTASTNAKTLRVRFGGTQVVDFVVSTNATAFQTITGTGFNKGATNSQIWNSSKIDGVAVPGSDAGETSAIDTTSAVTILVTGQKASSGETLTLTSYRFTLLADGT